MADTLRFPIYKNYPQLPQIPATTFCHNLATLNCGKAVIYGYLWCLAVVRSNSNSLIWRREGDSNPRQDIILNTLSRRAT